MTDPVDANHAVVERLAAAWPRRATVRSGEAYEALADESAWDAELPDYPLRLVPFADHPRFAEADPQQRQRVLTLAWLVYNERVITAEDHVANPAFALVQRGVFPGADTPALRSVVQQTLVDEHWHTHVHHLAVQRTCERRDVDARGWFPPSITYRTLLAEQAKVTEPWERDLLTLLWTVVSEISINALLCLLSTDDTIQPLHRAVTAVHAKDERAHGAVMVEVTKALWGHLTPRQRDAFVAWFPTAYEAFSAQDRSAWEVIVDRVGLAGGREMLAERNGGGLLVRDYSGLERLARQLGIRDRVEMEFPETPAHLREEAAATDEAA